MTRFGFVVSGSFCKSLRTGVKTRSACVVARLLLLCAFGLGLAPSAAAQITVTGTADDVLIDLDGNGTCDLREAIEAANTNVAVGECPAGSPGLDTIEFDIPGVGPFLIAPALALPTLNDGGGDPIILDGTSQPGASCPSTLNVGLVRGSGSNDALTLGHSNTVRGLVINNFLGKFESPSDVSAAGIVINGHSNHITCNFIGTNVNGEIALPNGIGIHVESGISNIIGADGDGVDDDKERNLISGNNGSGDLGGQSISSTLGIGIWDEGSDTVIAGNYIGTNATGRNALPNVIGIQLGLISASAAGKDAPRSEITGSTTTLVKENFVANSSDFGIALGSDRFFTAGSEDNCVVGNEAGVDKSGALNGSTAIFENNWFGASDGPTPPGSGDSVAGTDAIPFLTTPAAVCALKFKKTFTDDPVAPGGTVTLEFTITNPSDNFNFTDIGFTDDLDALIEDLTANGLPQSDVCGFGSLLTVSPAGVLELTDGRLAPGASCTFSVTVQVPSDADPDTYFNMTSALTGTIDEEGVTLDPAGDDLIVSGLLFSKSFTDDPVFPGDMVTLEFTITNVSGEDLEDLTFLDNVEAVLPGLIPSDGELPLEDVCGDGSSFDFQGFATQSKNLDGQTISALELLGGLLADGESCTFSLTLDVPPGAAPGTYLNSTTEITGVVVGSGGDGLVDGEPATDFLNVLGKPLLKKEFIDDPVGPGGSVTLKFTIDNPDSQNGATAISFSDDLDDMLAGIIATSFETTEGGDVIPITDLCGPGSSLDFTEDGILVFTGGSLTPDEMCMFSVTLEVPAGASLGDYVNAITDFTGVLGEDPGTVFTGEEVSDELTVAAVPLFTKEFLDDPILPGDDITLRFTIINTNLTEAASGVAFTDNLDILDIDGDPNTDVTTTLGLGGGETLPKTVCTTGTLSFAGGVLTMTGGSIPADDSCTFDVILNAPEEIFIDAIIGDDGFTGLIPGTYLNTTSTLASTVDDNSFESQAASDDFLVAGEPTFVKSFVDGAAVPGGTVVLSFTISNSDPNSSLTDIEFDDDLDAVLLGLVPTDLPKTDICGDGSGFGVNVNNELFLVGGSLDPGADCTFDVTLQIPAGAATGSYENLTSDLTATLHGDLVTVDGAFDELDIGGDLSFTKEFTDDPVAPGGTVTLKFTLTNDGSETASGLGFADNLEAMLPGITVVTSLPIFDACGDGSSFGIPTAALDKNRSEQSPLPPIELFGGTLDPGEMCMFSVELEIPFGADPGEYTNITTELTLGGEEVVAPPARDNLLVAAPLLFLKSFTDDPAVPGGTVTLEFSITNNSADDLDSITFTDDLGAVLAGLAPSAGEVPQTVCNGGTLDESPAGTLDFSGGSLLSGDACTFSVVLDVPVGASAGTHTNITSELEADDGAERLSGKVLDTITANPAMDDLEVAAIPVIRKEFTGDPVAPGGAVTLAFTITNPNTTEDASDIAFMDDLDAVLAGLEVTSFDEEEGGGFTPIADVCGAGSELTLTDPAKLTLTGGSLAPDSDCTFSVTVAVPAGATPGSYLNETTALTAVVDEESVTGNMAQDNLVVAALPLLVKSFTDDPVSPGGTVTLEFTLTNTSTSTIATDIEFDDDLDAVLLGLVVTDVPQSDICGDGSALALDGNVLEFAEGTLGPGASCTFSVTIDVPVGTPPGDYPNTTSAVAANVGGDPLEGNPATDDLMVAPAPELTKIFTDDPVIPGGTVTLEFTISYGEATASATNIEFSDDLDDVLAGLVATGLPLNDICGAGSRIDGTSELTLTGGSLDPETSCTFSVTLQVPGGAEPGTYTNVTSDLTADVDGLTVTGAPATDDLQIPTLLLSKEFTDDPVAAAGTVTLKFTLTNTGDEEATAISFLDIIDAMLPGIGVETVLPLSDVCGDGSTFGFSIGKNLGEQSASPLELLDGNLDPGEMCMFEVVLSIPPGTESGEYPNSTTEVTALIDGEEAVAPPASDVLLVVAPLTLLKEFTDDPVAPGATVTLEFNLTYEAEDGDPDATDITFDDDLEAVLTGLELASVLSNDCGGAVSGTSTISFSGGTLSPGSSCTIRVSLAVPEDALPGGYTNITSEIEAEVEEEGERSNSKALETITGAPAMDDLEVAAIPVIRKEFTNDPVAPGGTVTLEFTITNPNATEEATDIAFTDDLGAVLSGLAAVGLPADDVCGAGSELTGAGVLVLTGGTLPPGGSCVFTVTLMVPAGAALGIYTNETEELTATVDGAPVTGNTATDDLDVEGLPLLAKSFTDDPAAPGGTVTLAFTLTNTDPSNAASAIAFTDNLDDVIPGLELASVLSNDCGGTVSGTSTISFSGGSLGAGASCTITVSLTIPAGASEGSYPNTTSSVTAQVGGAAAEGSPASDDLDIVAIPVLSKSFIDDPVMPGETVTLAFTISHEEGTLDATNIAFTDVLDGVLAGLEMASVDANDCGGAVSGTSTISFSGGSLTAATSCTISVTLTVPGTATPGSTVTNTTSPLTADVGGVSVTGDPASDDLQIAGLLSLTKEFTDDPVAPGGTVILQFTLTNNDPSNAASAIAFTDNLDDVIAGLVMASVDANDCGGAVSGTSTISFSGGSLGAGASCTISVSLTVPDSAALTDYTNTTSEATATIGGETATALPATDELSVVEALMVEKSFTDDPVLPGGTVSLKFTITFEGGTEATDITFTDDLDDVLPGLVAEGLPADDVCGTGSQLTGTDVLTLTGGHLDPATMCMFTVTVRVPANALEGSFLNTTSIVEAQVDGETVEGSPATDELVVVSEAMIEATKAAELLDTDGLAHPGDMIKYTVEITNTTTDRDANGVIFTDTVDENTSLDCDSVTPDPSACTPGPGGSLTVDVGTLEDGETATIMFTVTIVNPYPSDPGTVENQGLVDGDNFAEMLTDDPDTGDEDDPTVTEVVRESDFSLTKTADPETPDYQDTVVFTLTVTNNGPVHSPAEITDILPDGLVFVEADPEEDYDEETGIWTTGEIPVGESRVLTVTALVDALEPVTNEATVAGARFPDPVAVNNSDDVEITPVATDLAITKSLTGFSGDPETNIITATFLLNVTNNGPSDATGVFVDDELPEGATLQTVPGDYNPDTGIWTIGDLDNGASTTLTLVMLADAQFNLLNIAIVSGDQPDQQGNNNLSAAQAQHDGPTPSTALSADLSLRITVDNEMPEVGDTITYSIDLTNDGPSPTAGVAVRALLAESQEFLSATVTPEALCQGCGYDDSLGVWTVGHVLKEATKTIAIRVVVGSTGEIANTAEVIKSYLPDPDSQPDNGEAEDDDQDSVMITVSQPIQTRDLAVEATLVEAAEVPTEFELSANYPNPFNPETTIPFAVPEQSHVRIVVYDLLGRQVALLLDEERSVGRYEMRWRADNVPTGVYIIRMQAEAFVAVRRITLIK